MALVIADRVRETTTSTGTGDLLLAGPYAGFQAFSVIGNGNTTYYAIIDNVTGQWEVGTGTYTTATNTLSRDAALASSNGGAKVVFGVGIKDVILTQPAERTVYLNAAGNGITVSANAFTNNGVVYANSTSTLTTGANLTFNGTLLNVTGDINLTGTLYQDGIPLSIGDVFGPSSATSGAVALFDGTTGKLLKNGGVSDALINGLTVGRGAGGTATNTVVGVFAFQSNTSASYSTALGYQSLRNNTSGEGNVAVGANALLSSTTGSYNVAVGIESLVGNSSGYNNTALGAEALRSNSSGYENVAVGVSTLWANSTGYYNTAVGSQALYSNTTGFSNVGVGRGSLAVNTSGSGNTAVGDSALYSNSIGAGNTAIGETALASNSSGILNTAVGEGALGNQTTGYYNTALGYVAGYDITTGSSNTLIGSFTGNGGGLDIRTANNYIVLSDGDGNPRVVVNGSGNVGLGNVAPAYRLDVGGSINFTGGLYQNGVPFTSGDVFGPASATAGAVALFDGTTGKLLKNGGVSDALINGLRVGKGAGGVVTNTVLGADAFLSNTTGYQSTAVGRNTLTSNTTGGANAAFGFNALGSNETGDKNTAVGASAMTRNTTGYENVAVGSQALYFNETGADNVAVGAYALWTNTTGSENAAFGAYALYYNTTGTYNTATGVAALLTNTTGYENTASGNSALYRNTTGYLNTASGVSALYSNTTGYLNTAMGYSAGELITTGSKNSILGRFSGSQGGLDITTANNYIVLSDGDGNPRIVTNGSGYVGINQVAPAYNLDVGGSINFTGSLYQNGLPFVSGSGDVVGPASATSGAVALYDGTTGKLLKDGGVMDALVNELTVGKGAGAVGTNTAVGLQALSSNTTGNNNTAVGAYSLLNITTTTDGTAVGAYSLYNNTGYVNTAFGSFAMYGNSTGEFNTALGASAMENSSTGSNNIAIGFYALGFNAGGSSNTVIGTYAGSELLTGSKNTLLGRFTGNQFGLDLRTASNYIVLSDGDGNPRVVVNGSGQVGINQITPAYNLDVGGDINFTGTLYQNGTPFAGGGTGDVVGPASATANAVTLYDGTTGKLIRSPADLVYTGTGLGIGTTSPAYKLDVTGDINFTGLLYQNGIPFGGGSGGGDVYGPTGATAGAVALFDGTSGKVLKNGGVMDALINGLTVGKGAGGIATNTAVGTEALYSNTTGYDNSAVGTYVLYSNTTGYSNVAVGRESLVLNTTGRSNAALGTASLYNNTTGNFNTAVGDGALFTSTTGVNNTAVGVYAGGDITTGSRNTILGSFSGNQLGLDIRTANNYIVLSDGNGNPRVVVNGSGQVGINQVAPAYNLDVGGSINFTGTLYQNGVPFGGGGGSGDVVGPASATSGAVALFDGTTGKLLKDGGATDALLNGIYLGRGPGNDITNTVFGETGLASNTTGYSNTVFGTAGLTANTSGSRNTAIGSTALVSNTTGYANTAVGQTALNANVDGYHNTAIGVSALSYNVSGLQNTAVGSEAMYTGGYSESSVAVGYQALRNSDGFENIAVGVQAMYSATSASSNTAVGIRALYSVTTSYGNTAVGYEALYSNTSSNNAAFGAWALHANTSGAGNTAVGGGALGNNTTGGSNTAVGGGALGNNTTGGANTAVGVNALPLNTAGNSNVVVGYYAALSNSSGSENSVFGNNALYTNTTGSENTASGYGALYGNSAGIRNTAFGYQAGANITTGSKNAIFGSFTGNQGGLDIRTANNYIVLSDGDGNPRQVIDGSGNVGIGVVAPSVKLDVGGAIKAAGLVESTTGGFKFPDGTTQTTAATGGGVTSFNTRTGAVTLTSLDVTTALGYTPYDSTNPSGYITSSALTPYLTSATAASTYQTILVSGTSIKTINSTSLLGSGNITTGDVVGPASATNNSLAQFDGTTGELLKSPSGLTYNGTTLSVTGSTTVASGTITASAPALDATQTWNNSGVTFTAARVNVTDTLSAAASMLLDLQVGGTSKFNVDKNGYATIGTGAVVANISGSGIDISTAGVYRVRIRSTDFRLASTTGFGWSSGDPTGSANDLYLYRDAANILAQRNGTAAQTFRLYNTFTDASNYERLGLNWTTNVATVAVENLGTGVARPLAVNVGGSERLRMFTSGGVSIGNTTDPGAANLSVTGTISSAGGVKLRTSATTSVTSPLTWSSGTSDQLAYTALANALTINADSGTPTDGQRMTFRFKDNGTPRVLTFTGGASKSFRNVGTVLTLSGSNWTYTTTASKTVYIGCIYNLGDDRWDLVSVAQEA